MLHLTHSSILELTNFNVIVSFNNHCNTYTYTNFFHLSFSKS